MKPNFIASQLRRTNRNLGFLTALELGLAIYLLSFGGITALVQMVSGIQEEPTLMGVISTLFDAGPVILMIIGIIILRYAVVNAVKLIMRIGNTQRHPIYQTLAWYGDSKKAVEYINAEIVRPDTKKYKTTYITDHWIVQKTALQLNIFKIEDVVWAYRAVTRHKQILIGPGIVAGPSEAGRTYSVVICTRNPRVPEIRISTTHQLDLTEDLEGNAQEELRKREYVTNILEALEQKHPGAVYGYSSDLEEMWSSDRASFIKSAGFGA